MVDGHLTYIAAILDILVQVLHGNTESTVEEANAI
jgi:hypothetical protein